VSALKSLLSTTRKMNAPAPLQVVAGMYSPSFEKLLTSSRLVLSTL
jgi:hypothetical protein